jgi:hypothetical protein
LSLSSLRVLASPVHRLAAHFFSYPSLRWLTDYNGQPSIKIDYLSGRQRRAVVL